MSDQLHLNAFTMNCVGHLNGGLWRHPADQAHRYKIRITGSNLPLLPNAGSSMLYFLPMSSAYTTCTKADRKPRFAKQCKHRSTTRCMSYPPWLMSPVTWDLHPLIQLPIPIHSCWLKNSQLSIT